jgi:2-C-methyl-D-erythritol 4-phosphate cytidylyltransferase
MHKVVVIAAGGTGTRMGTDIPKQFLRIHDKPIICYTIAQFVAAYADIEIIIAVSPNYEQQMHQLMKQYFITARYSIIHGGATRFHSVKNGIQAIHIDEAVVFVHDAARCMISIDLIKNSYEATLEKGSAVPCILPSDSLRVVENNGTQIIDRNKIRIVQTPQTFFYKDLIAAFAQEYNENFTDEASVVEKMGGSINLIEGEARNIKITNPFDLEIAKLILGNG